MRKSQNQVSIYIFYNNFLTFSQYYQNLTIEILYNVQIWQQILENL